MRTAQHGVGGILAAGAALLLGIALMACETAPAAPAATAPAPAPRPVAAAAEAMPPLRLAPRRAWRRIPIDTRGNIAAAWIASETVLAADGGRRDWIVATLREPIPIPETGGHAASAAFVADYRCDRHAWEPLGTIWFKGRDASGGEALREPPRGLGERMVAEGTLIDVFLDAACRQARRAR